MELVTNSQVYRSVKRAQVEMWGLSPKDAPDIFYKRNALRAAELAIIQDQSRNWRYIPVPHGAIPATLIITHVKGFEESKDAIVTNHGALAPLCCLLHEKNQEEQLLSLTAEFRDPFAVAALAGTYLVGYLHEQEFIAVDAICIAGDNTYCNKKTLLEAHAAIQKLAASVFFPALTLLPCQMHTLPVVSADVFLTGQGVFMHKERQYSDPFVLTNDVLEWRPAGQLPLGVIRTSDNRFEACVLGGGGTRARSAQHDKEPLVKSHWRIPLQFPVVLQPSPQLKHGELVVCRGSIAERDRVLPLVKRKGRKPNKKPIKDQEMYFSCTVIEDADTAAFKRPATYAELKEYIQIVAEAITPELLHKYLKQ